MPHRFNPLSQSEFDAWMVQIVDGCQRRSPETLDWLFDGLPRNDEILSQQIIVETVAQLQADPDTLGWFCGYMASEINRSEDNARPQPIADLCRKLASSGMQPFLDFMPYPGRRIVILAPEKLEALPQSMLAELSEAFDWMEQSGEQLQQVNEAIRQEFT